MAAPLAPVLGADAAQPAPEFRSDDRDACPDRVSLGQAARTSWRRANTHTVGEPETRRERVVTGVVASRDQSGTLDVRV